MEPSIGPAARPTQRTACVRCDGPLAAGDRYTCRPCVEAAYQACREITDRHVLASDILAVRRRTG
jgi:hypothetical protein